MKLSKTGALVIC